MKFAKWAWGPVAIVLLIFGALQLQPADNRPVPISGTARASFYKSFVDSCFAKQTKDPANKALKAITLSKFCGCFADRFANTVSGAEIARFDADAAYMTRPEFLTRVNESGKACAEAMRDELLPHSN
jgi:hypothetical protein